MPISLPISTEARQEVGRRVPSHKPSIDGTDAAGMIYVSIDAIEKLEVLVRELQVQVAVLERSAT
jgi:hypothetical protein